MTAPAREREIFLAKHRWLLLRTLAAIPEWDLDDPKDFLPAAEVLGDMVRDKLRQMGKSVEDVDFAEVKKLAEDLLPQLQSTL